MPAPSEDRILVAAERVFEEKGFGACSLRDLLTAAECSTTAFYARFPSKDAVLEALIRRLLEDLGDATMDALPRATSVSQGWDVGVQVLVDALRPHKGLVRVALTEAASVPGPKEALRDTYAALASLLEANLARLSSRGRIELADASALAWAIVGGLTMQVTRWAVFEAVDDAELVEALRTTARALLPASKRRQR